MSGDGGTAARGFPAFPPQRRGGGFARTWWGRAWITALEDTALDREQLRRGRAFAKSGRLGPITVAEGLVTAVAEDHDGSYRTAVAVERFGADERRRLLAESASRSGHVAALLDGELPRSLAAEAEAVGVRLLPGIGDLEPECECEGWELPCTHAAALCYQVSWLLDAEPFLLLALRGLGESELVAGLRDPLRVGVDRARAAARFLLGTDA